jgi:hypothetical protein
VIGTSCLTPGNPNPVAHSFWISSLQHSINLLSNCFWRNYSLWQDDTCLEERDSDSTFSNPTRQSLAQGWAVIKCCKSTLRFYNYYYLHNLSGTYILPQITSYHFRCVVHHISQPILICKDNQQDKKTCGKCQVSDRGEGIMGIPWRERISLAEGSPCFRCLDAR